MPSDSHRPPGPASSDETWALLQQALARQPDHVPTLLRFGRGARMLGKDAEAVSAFDRALRLSPDLPEPAFLLCATLLQMGNPRAQALLGNLLARFPDEAAGWEELGDVLLKLGKLEAALVCLNRAALAAPGFALAMRRGLILREIGRAAEAAAVFAQAVAIDPMSSRGWFLLGACSQDARDPEAAAHAYRRALALDPDLAEAAVNLGTALQDRGDLDAAKAAYAKALAARPDTFGRIAQAMTASPRGELWLDMRALRSALAR